MVDEYIYGFKELVEKAKYTDGQSIVMKFFQGLDPTIQNHIAMMMDGWLKDDNAPAWYNAVRTVALTQAANKAFQVPRSVSSVPTTFTAVQKTSESQIRLPILPSVRPAVTTIPPILATPLGPSPMDVNTAKRQFPDPLTCCHCGKVRHFACECPQAYNDHYMMAKECEELLEHWMAAADV